MIVTSTIVLVLALSGIPITEAAPIGTRNFDVRSMRRLEASQVMPTHVHHSATSYVPGGLNDKRAMDMAAPNVARETDEALTNKGWLRRRAVPHHVRDAAARRPPPLASDEAEQVKPVENIKRSEIPDINLTQKSEPAVEARTAPESRQKAEERRAELAADDRYHSAGNPPSNQSGPRDRDQRREELSGSGIAARHNGHDSLHNPGADSDKSPGDVNDRRSDSPPKTPGSLHVLQTIKNAFGSSNQ